MLKFKLFRNLLSKSREVLMFNMWPLFLLLFLAVGASLLSYSTGVLDLSFIPILPFILRWTAILGLALLGCLIIARRSFTPPTPFYSNLRDYWCAEIISEEAYSVLMEAIKNDCNILIAGEEEANKWSFARLVRDSRRMTRISPDRALFGDINNSNAALTLLEAWMPRKPSGLATITAHSAEEGLQRVENIIAQDILKSDSPEDTIQSLSGTYSIQDVIAETVNLVVYITHLDNQTESAVTEIISVKGFDHNTQQYITERAYYEPPQY